MTNSRENNPTTWATEGAKCFADANFFGSRARHERYKSEKSDAPDENRDTGKDPDEVCISSFGVVEGSDRFIKEGMFENIFRKHTFPYVFDRGHAFGKIIGLHSHSTDAIGAHTAENNSGLKLSVETLRIEIPYNAADQCFVSPTCLREFQWLRRDF
jgi:hypothetical protein